ncbi:MAG: methyl-accepting chemotaxis protein [Planctomycetota bacterium]
MNGGTSVAFGSIRATLLLWFLLITLGSVAAVAVVASVLTQRNLERSILEHLAALAETRAVQIEELVDARVAAVSALARDPSLVQAFESLEAGSGPDAGREAFLGTLAEGLGLRSLLLVSTRGRVLDAFGGESNGLDEADLSSAPWAGGPLASAVDRAGTLLQADLSALQPLSGRRRPALFVAGPVLDGPRVAGVLVAQIDEAPIDALIGDVSGLGETGQTVAVHDDGTSLVVAAPLRGDSDAAGTRRLTRDVEPYRRAIAGEGRVGYGIGPSGREVIGAWFHLPALRWSVSVEQDAAEAFAPARRQAWTILGIAAVLAIPAGLAALIVASTLGRPIRSVAQRRARAAAGDLRDAPQPSGRGELRQLLESLARMMRDLGGMLGGVRRTSRDIAITASEVRETAGRQHTVVQDLGSSAAEIAAAVEEMSATGTQLATTADGVGSLAEATAARAERGRRGLDRMRESIGGLDRTSEGVCGHLAEIRERADGVGAVVVTITRVANRTNLLSINAAIEAEKAGAHGRGFGVVATEINRLADQTAAAALEVEAIVDGMQQSVSAGAEAMDGLAGVVRSSVETASEVAADLAAILAAIADLRDRFTELRDGVDAQSQGALQVRDAMRQLRDSSRLAGEVVERLQSSAVRLDEASRGLEGAVDRFQLEDASA